MNEFENVPIVMTRPTASIAAREGVRAFVILQPFGCIPNHVVGRGISRRLKAMFPDIQLLPLDYDPDVSFVDVENRLQMLVMNIRSAV